MATNLIEIIIRSIVEHKGDVSELTKAIEQLAKEVEKTSGGLQNLSKESGLVSDSANNVKDALGTIASSVDKQVEDALSAIKKLRAELEASGDPNVGAKIAELSNIENLFASFKSQTGNPQEKLELLRHALEDFGKAADVAKPKFKDLNELLESLSTEKRSELLDALSKGMPKDGNVPSVIKEALEQLPPVIVRVEEQLKNFANFDPNTDYLEKAAKKAAKLEEGMRSLNEQAQKLILAKDPGVEKLVSFGLESGIRTNAGFSDALLTLGGVNADDPEDLAAKIRFAEELKKLGVVEDQVAEKTDNLGKKFVELGGESIPVARSALKDFANEQIDKAFDANVKTLEEFEAQLRATNNGVLGLKESFALAFAKKEEFFIPTEPLNTAKLSVEELDDALRSLERTLTDVGVGFDAGNLRQFVVDTAKESRTGEGVVTGVAGELAKSIQGLTQDDLEKLTEGVIRVSQAFKTDFIETAKEAAGVVNGLDNSIANTTVSLEGFGAGGGSSRASALAEAMSTVDENSNKAKEEVDSLKDSVKKTGDEGGKAIESLNTAMTSLGAIAVNLDGKFAGVFRIVSALQNSVGLLGIAGAAAALIGITKSVADLGSELRKTSVLTGIGVADLGALKIAAEQNESSLAQLSIGLRTFNRELSQAVTAGGAAQKQFLDLGFTNQQLTEFYTDTGSALEAIAKKILEAGTATKQTELATRFFSRAGRELIPLLKEIAEKGLPAMRAEAEAAGLVMSEKASLAAKKFNDNLTTLQQTLQGFNISFFGPIIEFSNFFVEQHPEIVKGIGAVTGALIGLAAAGLLVKAAMTTGLITSLAWIAGLVGLSGPLAGFVVLAGAVTAALILYQKATKGAGDSIPRLNEKLDAARAQLEAMEEAGDGASDAADRLRESIKKLADEAFQKQSKLKEITDEIERIKNAANSGSIVGGATSFADRQRLKILEAERDALTGQDFNPDSHTPAEDAVSPGPSPQAVEAFKQIKLLQAEAAKAAVDIAQQTANGILEQTGRIEDFFETTRRNQEEFRKQSLVSIEEQFAKDKETFGTTPESQAAAASLRNQRISDLDRGIAQKFQKEIENAGLLAEKIQKELSAAFEGRQQAEIELGKTRVEIASRSLELSVAQINNVDELVAKAKEINALERANLEAAIKINEQKLRELNSKALSLNYEDDNGVALQRNEAEQRKITAEIEKQNAQLKESNNRIRKILDQLLAFRKIDFDIDATKAQTALTGLTTQLDRMKEAVDLGESIPFSEFLRVAKEIDAIQARIRQGQIDFQALSIQALERQKQESVLNEDERLTLEKQIVLEQAKLELMTKQAEVSRDEQERRQKIELERSIDALAGSSAKSFVDRLLQGLQDKKIDFQEFFAGLGKTLVSDLLQEVVKEGLKSGLRAQAELLGEKPADTAGGQFLQTMKFLLNSLFGVEFGKATQKAADPLVTAADAIKQAGESSANAHKSAAELHLQAAGALLQAGNNLAGVGPGGIKIAGQTPASVSDDAGAFAEAFAEAANEAFTSDSAAFAPSSGGVSFNDSAGGGFNLGSLFGGGAGIAGGIGAIMGGGGGIGGILSKIQGGIGAIKGITDIIGSIDKIFGGVDVLGRFDFPRIGSDLLGGGGGFFDFLKDIPFLGDFFKIFGLAKGGMVGGGGPLASAQLGHLVSSGAIRKFRTGDMVRGATLGVIGEEGPEIVARMKPAGAHDMRSAGEDSDGIRQNIYIVDQRRQNLGPEDVELIIEDSMARGRRVSKAVENVIKRRR